MLRYPIIARLDSNVDWPVVGSYVLRLDSDVAQLKRTNGMNSRDMKATWFESDIYVMKFLYGTIPRVRNYQLNVGTNVQEYNFVIHNTYVRSAGKIKEDLVVLNN